jgi:hypothetical protein
MPLFNGRQRCASGPAQSASRWRKVFIVLLVVAILVGIGR